MTILKHIRHSADTRLYENGKAESPFLNLGSGYIPGIILGFEKFHKSNLLIAIVKQLTMLCK